MSAFFATRGRAASAARFWEDRAVFFTAALFVGLRLLENVLFGGAPFEMDGGAGSQVYQISLISVCLLVVLAGRPWADLRMLLVLPLSMAIALIWCWISISWSIAPGISLRRVTQISLVIFVIFTIVEQLGYTRTLRLLRIWFVIALALCYLYALVNPSIGIQQPSKGVDSDSAGSWRGIFIDKNVCGAFCAATMSLFIFDAKEVRIYFRWLIVACALFFLIQSASKTAMGVQVIALAVGFASTRYNSNYRALLFPSILIFVVVAVFGWHQFFDPFRQALYDPTAFTGRGPIWATLILYLQDHWLLGTGFSAFWAVPNSPVFEYSDAAWVRETVRIGHNGYLDLWATIGLPGLILILIATVAIPLTSLLVNDRGYVQRTPLIVSVVIFVIGQNFTESSFFHEKSFVTVILLFIVALSHVKLGKQGAGLSVHRAGYRLQLPKRMNDSDALSRFPHRLEES